MEEGLNHVDGQPSLCYWPWATTIADLCIDVRIARLGKKFQMQIPNHLNKDSFEGIQRKMFDFKSKKIMGEVDVAPLSSVIFDLRSA